MMALREAFSAFRRAPLLSVLGVVTIAFSLFAFGLFGLVAINIRDALQSIENRVEIRAFIADGTPVEASSAAMGDINAFPEVASVTYVSQEDALVLARKELGEFSDVFEPGVLPASLDVKLKPGFRDPETVKAVANRIRSYDFVDDVRYGEDWVAKLYRLRTIATLVGTGLGLAFAAVAVIIIGATIRIMVMARAREISIMRLVGATNGFIRLPFVLEGFIQGVLGGLLALGLTWATNSAISHSFMRTAFFDPWLATLGVIGGALIGLLGSTFAVGRQLRRL
ncbi:MAG: ABC transporter permease [Gemmatimonadota bacterium]|nr:ABC transporter permease [Gemmatimonadota bacterium]